MASTSDGLGVSIELLPTGLTYSADMRARLSGGVTFTGDFTLQFPSVATRETFNYRVFYEGNGVTRTFDTQHQESRYFSGDDGQADELVVSLGQSNPAATTLLVEEGAPSAWFSVLAFSLDTGSSTNDISLVTVPVVVSVSSSTYETIVNDAELVIDGITFDAYSVENGTSSTATLLFAVNDALFIDFGESVTAELRLRFNALIPGNEGTTVSAELTSVTVDSIVAEGAALLSTAQLQGSAIGEVHTLRARGILVTLDNQSAMTTVVDGNNNDYATYQIQLDITAFRQDVYISTNPASSTTWRLLDSSSLEVASGTRTAVITSTADEVGNYFEINEGETETVTFIVTYASGITVSARLWLDSISYAATPVLPNQTWIAFPATNYRTDIVTLVN